MTKSLQCGCPLLGNTLRGFIGSLTLLLVALLSQVHGAHAAWIGVTSPTSGIYYINDGGADRYDNIPAGEAHTVTYTVWHRSGSSERSNLTLQKAVASNLVNVTGISITDPGSTTLVVGTSTTFTVTYTPKTVGAYSFNLSIRNNDTDQDPFNFTANGTATSPEIEVTSPETGKVTNGGADDHGNEVIGVEKTVTYTIKNTGSADLRLLGPDSPTVSNSNNLRDQNARKFRAVTIAPNASTTFDVVYTPNGAGPFSFDLSFGTNDGDENPFKFTVKGTATAAAPKIEVVSSETGKVTDGGADALGNQPTGVEKKVTYTIWNRGNSALEIRETVESGAKNVKIGGITAPASKVDPGGHTELTVTYTTEGDGPFSFDLSIRNNDPDENPFKFTVSGTAAANPAITTGQIGSFMQARSELILANQPGIGRGLDRLNGRTGGATGISGFGLSLSHPGLPFSARLGRNEGSFAWSLRNTHAQSAKTRLEADLGAIAGALRIPRSDDTAHNANTPTNGPANIHALTSAEPVANWKRSGSDDSTSSSGVLALGPTDIAIDTDPAADPMAQRFDMWAQGSYSAFSASGGKGRFAIVHAGADYLVNPNLLIGLGLQADWTTMDASKGAQVKGYGFMAGPYATARLADGFYADARIAWGRSFNKISPFGTYTDPFRAERWLGSAALIGETSWNMLTIRPELRLSWFRERSKAYVDTLGVAIPAVTVETGTLEFGPTFTLKPFEIGSGLLLTPHLTVEGIWTFAQTNTATTVSQQPGLGETGVRGRVEAGLNLADDNGTSVNASAFYDGIGNADFKAWGAKLSVHKAF